jgi:transposase-like protein
LAARSACCTFAGNGFGGEHAMIEFKGSHFERDVILWAVRWYVAYPISYRQLEEMMEEHGVAVTTPRSIAGCSNMFRYWIRRFARASAR